jgi:hypothetical protein
MRVVTEDTAADTVEDTVATPVVVAGDIVQEDMPVVMGMVVVMVEDTVDMVTGRSSKSL